MQTKFLILFFIFGILFPIAGTFAKGSFYDFKVKDIKGNEVPLSKYKGKVVMVVNVASKCGYTYQYDNLEKVYKKYKDQGFAVVGFPANNFGSQEPGSDKEIETFCRIQKGASFDMMSKISVKGKDQHPLYQYLTQNSPNPGEVQWNFEKILISKDGKIEARYLSAVEPDGVEVSQKIESLLK